jgi:hypothetical protein
VVARADAPRPGRFGSRWPKRRPRPLVPRLRGILACAACRPSRSLHFSLCYGQQASREYARRRRGRFLVKRYGKDAQAPMMTLIRTPSSAVASGSGVSAAIRRLSRRGRCSHGCGRAHDPRGSAAYPLCLSRSVTSRCESRRTRTKRSAARSMIAGLRCRVLG